MPCTPSRMEWLRFLVPEFVDCAEWQCRCLPADVWNTTSVNSFSAPWILQLRADRYLVMGKRGGGGGRGEEGQESHSFGARSMCTSREEMSPLMYVVGLIAALGTATVYSFVCPLELITRYVKEILSTQL